MTVAVKQLHSTKLLREVAALLGMAVLALTEAAPLAALVPPLVAFAGEITGRRSYSAAAVMVSTLYVAQAPLGLREAPLVLGMLLLGFVLRYVRAPGAITTRHAVPFILLVPVFVVSVLARPPATVTGWFSVFEQGCVLVSLAVFLTTSRMPLEAVDQIRSFGHAALLAVAIVAGIDANQYVNANGTAFAETRQIISIFGGSNYVAALLALAAVSCMYLAVTLSSGRSFHLIAAGVCTLLLAPLDSRTSVFALALATAYLLLTSRRRFLAASAAAVALIVGATLAPSLPLVSRFIATGSSLRELNGREELWIHAVAEIRANPLLGTGSGRLADSLIFSGSVPYYVHDVWLSLIAQYGLWIVVFLFFGLRALFSRKFDRHIRVLTAALLLISTFEPAVETLRLGLIFAALIGMGTAISCRPDDSLAGKR